jgi:general secretion pathway protein D
MSDFNRLVAVVLAALLIGPTVPLEAKTRKGDKYLVEGRMFEEKKQWDEALEQYEKALSEDPSDLLYQMATEKARFQASQKHVDEGLRIRALGQLGEALLQFQRAYQINPGSSVAEQEIVRTQQMIERERKRVEETGKEAPPSVRGLTPAEQAKKETQEKIKRMLPVPELKPLNPTPINLKINAQPVKVLFETVGKMAGLNVLWDPDYQNPARNSLNVEIENSTAEEALDYLAVITKSYWKPLSPNTIFITNDNPNKRRDFAEMVAKTFYLTNLNLAQELQEVMNVIRTVAEVTRVVVYNSQNAIIVRGEADQVALAEKLIRDLDKPRPEVVVDIMVIEVNNSFSRQLTAAIASTGLNVPINFNPRSSIQAQVPGSGTGTGTDTGTGTGTGTTDTTSGSMIPLSQLGHLSTADFAITVPSALLQAVLSDTKTKVMQAPQLRSVDNAKASLKIGEREPTATGSFQPGIGGVGINPLVNTQFNYIDVGVNVEMTPRVHENGDVSIHISLDISSVTGSVNLGGINQPIIGQRKVEHDIRMHEGEVNLLGGLINQSETRGITGIPGLSSIPLLGRLFSGESTQKQRGELMIALIPHIIRRPEYSPDNLRGIAAGNQTSIRLNYAPAPPEPPARAAAPSPAPGTAKPPVAAVAPGAAAPAPAPAATPAAAPALTPPATAPPATAPPATAPPATAPPATAPGAAPAGQPNPPGSNVQLRLTPAQIDTTVSNNFTVAVTIEGATDVASAPMQVQFDPKILRLNDVTRGDFLSSDSQPPVFTKNIMNDSGSAAIQLNRLPGTPGANGSGVIAVLSFQAVGKGVTAVTLPNLTVRNSQGQVVGSASPRLLVNVK